MSATRRNEMRLLLLTRVPLGSRRAPDAHKSSV